MFTDFKKLYMELNTNHLRNHHKINVNSFRGLPNLNGTPQISKTIDSFSQSFDTFIKKDKIIESEENHLIQYFANKLNEWTKNDLFGSGQHNLIYKIEDGKYLFKIPRNSSPEINKITIRPNSVAKNLKTYKGNTIADFGNISILKNAGKDKMLTPAGYCGNVNDITKMMCYYNEIYLTKFSSLPQSSFDDIAHDFAVLNKSNSNGKRYTFDTINPNNFQARSDGKIIILDNLEETFDYNTNSMAKMFRVFSNSVTHDVPAEFDIMAVGKRRNLFKKIVLACEKNELPFGASTKDRAELNLAMRLCNFDEPFSEVHRTLSDYRRNYLDINVRLSKIEEYLNELDYGDTRFNTFAFYE